MITLKSCNGETFEVEESVVLQFQAIWYMFEDLFAASEDPDALATIPLPNVSSEILAMVIKYCKHHVDAVDKDLKSFDADFLNVDQGTLFDLILAANYFNIKDLLDLTCQTVADMI